MVPGPASDPGWGRASFRNFSRSACFRGLDVLDDEHEHDREGDLTFWRLVSVDGLFFMTLFND